jgi:hypothetical protein
MLSSIHTIYLLYEQLEDTKGINQRADNAMVNKKGQKKSINL